MILINEYMGGSRGSCGNVIMDPFQHSTYLNTKQRSMITSIVSKLISHTPLVDILAKKLVSPETEGSGGYHDIAI